MAKLFFTLLFSLSFFISGAQATQFTSRENLNSYCDKIMQTLVDGRHSEAIQLFRKNSVMDTVTINNIDMMLSEQMTTILPFYKKITGYVLVEEKEVKNTLARRRYLLTFERYFLTFDFILYNNGTGWTVSNFNYKDDPKELF